MNFALQITSPSYYPPPYYLLVGMTLTTPAGRLHPGSFTVLAQLQNSQRLAT